MWLVKSSNLKKFVRTGACSNKCVFNSAHCQIWKRFAQACQPGLHTTQISCNYGRKTKGPLFLWLALYFTEGCGWCLGADKVWPHYWIPIVDQVLHPLVHGFMVKLNHRLEEKGRGELELEHTILSRPQNISLYKSFQIAFNYVCLSIYIDSCTQWAHDFQIHNPKLVSKMISVCSYQLFLFFVWIHFPLLTHLSPTQQGQGSDGGSICSRWVIWQFPAVPP